MDQWRVPSKIKPKPSSVRLPDDLEREIVESKKVTGMSQSDLIIACVARSLGAVVADIIERQRKEGAKFLSERKKRQ